jgi:subfamily B ATP-binding cassette protein MsbA
VLDNPVAIEDSENAHEIESFQNEIQLKGVSFSYGEGLAIDHINLDIPRGKSIALVGQSGSGKTTIANLLPRFYDVTSGGIEIDGKDLRELKLKSIRNLMGIVTQESILFNDTIASNIKLGKPDATPEEVRRAAEIANAHDFIELLPDGYNTNIGDGGNRLSGGQKQRISIARAVLKNPPILILDEATSALDTESERLVQEALENVMQNRTSIVIAHRLSTIQNADVIVVMQKGQIAEKGDHDTLMAKGGIYARLIELQSFNG